MAHLDTWNTSYGQKKSWTSNWQFDSWPLKVENCPNFLTCGWLATYNWKDVDKGYNFSLNLILIEGLHTKLWAPKVVGVPTLGISGLPLGSPGTKCHFDAGPMARHIVYYKGEGGGFPQVRAMVSFVSPNLSVACPRPKVFQLCINQLVVWFVQVHVSDWLLVILPSFIPELQHALLPPKCFEPRSVPQLLTLSLFSLRTHIWVYQGAWERVIML
jgi:hypothetical protein